MAASPGISFNEQLVDSPGWFWNLPGKSHKGWAQPTWIWRLLTTSSSNNSQQWNIRWQVNWDMQQWKALWRQLWAGWGHPRTKFLLWGLIHFGFFTQAHGSFWKVCSAVCPICSEQDESILHLFLQCSRVHLRWRQVLSTVSTTSLSLGAISTPVHPLQCARVAF
jgi:hypothetical protein